MQSVLRLQLLVSDLFAICFLISSAVLITTEAGGQEQFFKLVLNDIKGNPVHFDQFQGKVTLLVNTASQCSHTDSHMQSLKRLHDILSYGSVFNVIAFPCNEFGGQEPWEAQEIEEYYRGHFGVEFVILEKGSVADSPLWQWIRRQSGVGEPEWNFHKYLIDGQGKVVGDWAAEVSVESIFDMVQSAIDKQIEINATPAGSVPETASSDKQKGDKDEL